MLPVTVAQLRTIPEHKMIHKEFGNWRYFVILALLNGYVVLATEYRGFVELDDLSFDKVIKRFDAVLVKFDVAYPYGAKHESFAKFAEQLTVHIDNFLVATVGIKDYGERENSQLAERFKVGTEYPVIKLFTNGNTNSGMDYPKGKCLGYDYTTLSIVF